MSRPIRMIVILAALALLAGLATVRADDQKEGGKTTKLARKGNPADVPSAAQPPINSDYRLGVNDVVDVYVWREPELSRVIPVRPDGKISLPLVGELEAQGRTALELRQAIAERLRAYVGEPEVTVIIQQINSQRYFVIGEVQNPGVFPLTVPTTVMQALAMAGGFREFADTGNILILRRLDDNRMVRIEFSYKEWVRNKKPGEHLELKNGDVIVVR